MQTSIMQNVIFLGIMLAISCLTGFLYSYSGMWQAKQFFVLKKPRWWYPLLSSARIVLTGAVLGILLQSTHAEPILIIGIFCVTALFTTFYRMIQPHEQRSRTDY